MRLALFPEAASTTAHQVDLLFLFHDLPSAAPWGCSSPSC